MTDITKNSVGLTWLPPLRDGGARVDGYIIELQQEGSRADYWVEHTVVKDLSFNITGLKENKKYKFRVSARNSVGRGLPRETEGFLEVKEQLSKWMILPVAEEFLEIVNLSKLKFIMFCKMLKTILRLFFVNK